MSKILSGELVGVRESVADELLLLNPHETPLLNLLGFADVAIGSVEHTWFEDKMFADESVAVGAVAVDGTEIAVADVEPFVEKSIVQVGEELIKVVAVDEAGKKLTVQRGYAGTTATAIADGAQVEYKFVEGVEGADAREARFKARARKSNLTQIFDLTVKISRTAANVSQYGIDDLYELEKQKKQLELALMVEKAAIAGVKYESADGLTRTFGGIRNQVVTNVLNGGGNALNEDIVNDLFQKMYENGAKNMNGYVILVGAKQKRAFSKMGNADVRIERLDSGRGRGPADHFVSDFGTAEIMLDNNLAPDEVIVIDPTKCAFHPLRNSEFAHEYLGKTGDFYSGQIVGEYTFVLKQEETMGRIRNLG